MYHGTSALMGPAAGCPPLHVMSPFQCGFRIWAVKNSKTRPAAVGAAVSAVAALRDAVRSSDRSEAISCE